jgi:hypothetical protein
MEPPLVVPAKLCAIEPAPLGRYRVAAKVKGYAKVAFAVPNSCAGDVLGPVARLTPSVLAHFCSPTANCLSSSSRTVTSFPQGLIRIVRDRRRRVNDLEFQFRRFELTKSALGTR